MLKTDAVIKLLKKEKQLSFDAIWNSVKDETIASISIEKNENEIKTDLYMSLMEDQTFIMLGDNNWGIKASYSYEEIDEIKKSRITDDIEEEFDEESDDTRELKLGLTSTGEDE